MGQYPFYTEPDHTQGTVAAAPRTSATTASEGSLKVDMVDKIFLLESTVTPFVTFLTNVGKGQGKSAGILKASCGNPTFDWLEDYFGGKYAKVNVAYNNSDDPVTITVSGAGSASGRIFTKGDVILNARTGERMKCASSASDTTITASRSVGTTAATAGVVGDGLYIIGNVNEENATARNVNMTQKSKQTNYTQIFRESISVSRTDKNSDLYGGSDLQRLRQKKGIVHAQNIERAFWFGEKAGAGTGTNGLPERYTGGVLELIEGGKSYVQNQGGVLTAPDFRTFLREGFTYGNNTKMLFAGGVVIQAIEEFALGKLVTKQDDTTFGIKINKYTCASGDINIVKCPLFVEDYAGYAFLLDLESFRYRYLKDSDTILNTNIQANGTDGQVDEYLTECGLERKQAPRHALLKGVTS